MSEENATGHPFRARVRQFQAAEEQFLATAPAEEQARYTRDRRTFAAEMERLAQALRDAVTAQYTVADALDVLAADVEVQTDSAARREATQRTVRAIGAMEDQEQAYHRDAKAIEAQAERTIRRLGARYPWLLDLLPLEAVPF